jgi:CBS domain-containing protein
MASPSNQGPVLLASLVTPSEILCGLDDEPEDEILRRLIERMAASGHLESPKQALDILVTQKCCSFAYLDPDVAIFHARLAGVDGLCLALAPTRRSVQCCWTTDPLPVRLFALILAPQQDPTGYLRVIAALKELHQRPGVMDCISRCGDPRAVWEAIAQAQAPLPPFITAGDIMRRDFPRLTDRDTVSQAVDAFCRLGVSELAVVDAEGDLLGVVSEDELIRICLPEYVTWMEDLTPILDFQPFAEILQREAQMPLIEIMRLAEHCPTVDEGAPAIQVAKIMMRNDVRQVWVLSDGHLAGIISIQDFIRKVLRA